MPNSDLDQLAALIRRERDGLLAQWRQQVSVRQRPERAGPG
jgi:hypothetical protein